VAILGSGDSGTDLMIKIGQSDGPLSVAATVEGIDELLDMPDFGDIRLVFDTTSAETHAANWARLAPTGVRMIDLTSAAVGPYCVPAVNVDDHRGAHNLNMVTGGAQATVPIVAAVARSGIVSYAEIVCAVASQSAGPGTRVGIDEFLDITSAALREVGGARRGKAVLLLSPADPPVLMRSTVYCLVDGDTDRDAVENDIVEMVERVSRYVPGYRLKQRVQFEAFGADRPLYIPETGTFTGTRVTVMLEVTGAAHHLPAYAGNLDIMTSAAKATAEHIAIHASGIPA
jgi:acetaldehyde dehydrogenase